MEKIYSYELSVKDLKKMKQDIAKITSVISSKEFLDYLGQRIKEALLFIQKSSLTTVKTKEDIEMSNYMNSNHLEIEGDTILIYNDAVIDIASKNMKETTKARYPAQLSLAKIVEYGIGYMGATTEPQQEVEDWEYDVQGHGVGGWFYRDDGGTIHWTNGFQGRMIFYQLKLFVKSHIAVWCDEYIKEKL